MLGVLRFLLAAVVALGMHVSAEAADIEVLNLPDVPVKFISFKGEIVSGDGQKFSDIVQSMDKATVILESPGGLVKEALEIGATIRLQGLSTMVAGDGKCFSACGLVWVSGVRRYLSDTSLLGFHAAYREENGEYRESGVANAEIGSFLTHLGLRIEAIRFFTIAGPNDFLLLTPDRARALGIDVYELNGSHVTSPGNQPVVDTYADRFVSYGFLQSRCVGFLQPDMEQIKAAQVAAFEAGNKMVSAEGWVKLWTPLLDVVKQQVKEKGALRLCIETEEALRTQGQPTGVNGPSFNCAAASTPTERALCAEAGIWAKDRAVAAIYLWIRDGVDKATRKKLLIAQRSWLKARNGCGGNTQCLYSVYNQRLHELRMIEMQ